jgi:hypothetical protein
MPTKCLLSRATKHARTRHSFPSSRHVDGQPPILCLSWQLVAGSSPHTTHTVERLGRKITSQYGLGTSDDGEGCEYGLEYGLQYFNEKSMRRLEWYPSGTNCAIPRRFNQKPLSFPHRLFLRNRSENGGTELRSLRRYPAFPRSNRNEHSLNRGAESRRSLHSTSV